ncbi:MAG: hypothetical protein SGILL_007243 [Bacillariaceae sp.]
MSEQTVMTVTVQREAWHRNFHELKLFYDAHGHVSLPTTNPSYTRLSQWLTYQRYHATCLTKQQLELLNSIDYKSIRYLRGDSEKEWCKKFKRLEKLHNETGLLRVSAEERDLGRWLSNQRSLMRSNSIAAARRKKLEELGVRPSDMNQNRRTASMKNEKWHNRYDELKAFCESKGHSDLPMNWKENPSLANWVKNQRRDYRLSLNGVKSMDEDRIRLLEAIKFKWKIRKTQN